MIPKFSLTWDSFKNNVCSGFTKLQQDGEFVDMTLAADGHFVKVHKNLVSLASPYIMALIKTAPCKHPVVFLDGLKYEILCCILEYIYTGEVEVPKHILPVFLRSAKALQLVGIHDTVPDSVLKEYNLIPKKEEQKPEKETVTLLENVKKCDENVKETQKWNAHKEADLDISLTGMSIAGSISNLDNLELQALTPLMQNADINTESNFAPPSPSRISTPQLTEFFSEILPETSDSNSNVLDTNRFFINEPTTDFQENSLLENNIPEDSQSLDSNMDLLQEFALSQDEVPTTFTNESFLNMPEIQIAHTENGFETIISNMAKDDTVTSLELASNSQIKDLEPEISEVKSPSILSQSEFDDDDNAETSELSNALTIPTLEISDNVDGSCFLIKKTDNSSKRKRDDSVNIQSSEKKSKTTDYKETVTGDTQNKISIKITQQQGNYTSSIDIPTPTQEQGFIQYTVSNLGKLQLILNRCIFSLETTSRLEDVRKWRCADYRNKKCPAYIITRGDSITKRAHPHNHEFHDARILKKVQQGLVFAAVQDALSKTTKKKS